MLEMIHENRIRTQELKKMIIDQENKKRNREERNILILCGVAIVILITINTLNSNKNIEKCVKKGYTESYCISQLG